MNGASVKAKALVHYLSVKCRLVAQESYMPGLIPMLIFVSIPKLEKAGPTDPQTPTRLGQMSPWENDACALSRILNP